MPPRKTITRKKIMTISTALTTSYSSLASMAPLDGSPFTATSSVSNISVAPPEIVKQRHIILIAASDTPSIAIIPEGRQI